MTVDDLVNSLREVGVESGDPIALASALDVGLGLAVANRELAISHPDPMAVIGGIEEALSPRWIWWSRHQADCVARADLSVDRCWDILTVHRLLNGGWQTSIPTCWAQLRELDLDALPTMGQLGLLDASVDEGDDPEKPIRPDGHLRPEWVNGGWRDSPQRLASWASLAFGAHTTQAAIIERGSNAARTLSTARAESAADLLCAELEQNGLPIDENVALKIIVAAAGPRPPSRRAEDAERARRDEDVLRHLEPRQDVNLRNPAEVKAMLRRTGLDLPDTRAWRLEQLRDTEPLIDALLVWRKAERIATTYGHTWLDEHVSDGRLRGDWSSCDGAAGRMTASAGLHNLPAPMRPAIVAEQGYVFVRADLGQIEPRILAAVSGDDALIAATLDDDLYQPVASRLGVDRDVAKVAVLGAMYGATTGESAGALRGLQKNYPVAMALLEAAAEDGRLGRDVFTSGGRRVRMWVDDSVAGDIDKARSVAASRGRFARNALIQGAAAEFFKVWAITVRRRAREHDARIVLCLHDELVVHVPESEGDAVAKLVHEAVAEAAHYWSPRPDVRFLADVSVIDRWSDAKD